jgi:fumarylacetoacetase
MTPDSTLNPALRSWVQSANTAGSDFPIQNLPFGCFRLADGQASRIGIAIGDQIFDLLAAREAGLLDGLKADVVDACGAESLTPLFVTGRGGISALRQRVSVMLQDGSAESARAQQVAGLLVAQSAVTMAMPAEVGDYTDFYASIDHATNVGSMFRPDNPLLPNYKHVPIGYHGRASSLVVSGTPVKRPMGQTSAKPEGPPTFGPSARMDYELEVGAFIAGGNAMGHAIPLREAEQHIAGLVLVSDWSARDVQTWEYQPLGPFLAKNFATSVSPWVVTLDALEPFRVPARARAADDPAVLPYLVDEKNERAGGFGITLEVSLLTAKMREAGESPARITRGDFTRMYWTLAQMLTHHASNGCNMRAGDLIASGTVSGATKDSRGCLLELTWRGTEPLTLPNGETRTFLADGDEVIIRGYCEKAGAVRIGLGECRGVLLPVG